MGVDCRWLVTFKDRNTLEAWRASYFLYDTKPGFSNQEIRHSIALRWDILKSELVEGKPGAQEHSLQLIEFKNGNPVVVIDSTVRHNIMDLPDNQFVCYQWNRLYCRKLYEYLLPFCTEIILISDSNDIDEDMRMEWYRERNGIVKEKIVETVQGGRRQGKMAIAREWAAEHYMRTGQRTTFIRPTITIEGEATERPDNKLLEHGQD